MAAPAFLFMAGIAVALGAAAHMRRGRSPVEAAGWSSGAGGRSSSTRSCSACSRTCSAGFRTPAGLLKVDILNIMGPAIVAAACVWRLPGSRLRRALVLAGGAALIAVATPAIRDAGVAVGLARPARVVFQARPRQRHVHPVSVGRLRAGRGGPWCGPRRGPRLGAVAAPRGDWPGRPRPGGGVLLGRRGSRRCSPRPASGPRRRPSSPFASGCWCLWWPWPGSGRSGRGRVSPRARPLEVLGVGSLFVYWVHVELVYGGATRLLAPAAHAGAGGGGLGGLHGGHVLVIAGLEPAGPCTGQISRIISKPFAVKGLVQISSLSRASGRPRLHGPWALPG